jgi:chorismate synthase
MTNAKDQFVHDYTIVIDNDFTAWRESMEIVTNYSASVPAISEQLREQFEAYISEVADREDELGNEIGALLIKQMLLGWGSDAFDAIARHYIEKDAE